MTGSRVALVADHPPLAEILTAHLLHVQGHAPFVASYENVRDYVAVDTDGLLLIAVGSPAEVTAACHLVQDLSLQKLPPLVVLVEGLDALVGGLAPLEKYV